MLSKLECFNKIFAVEVSISIINDLISCDQSYKIFDVRNLQLVITTLPRVVIRCHF